MFFTSCKGTEALAELKKVTEEAASKEEGREKAAFFKDVVFAAMT